mgnify:CR=1 FL=1
MVRLWTSLQIWLDCWRTTIVRSINSAYAALAICLWIKNVKTETRAYSPYSRDALQLLAQHFLLLALGLLALDQAVEVERIHRRIDRAVVHGAAADVLRDSQVGPIGMLAGEIAPAARWLRNRLCGGL